MDLSPDYDAPVTIKLVSATYKTLAADVADKLKARDDARNTSTDAQLKESTLQAWLDAKAKLDSLGDAAFVKIDFPRVEWPQLKELGKKLKAQSFTSIHARADETRLPHWERFRALQEADVVGKSVPDVIRYAKTDDGVDEILNAQFPKAGLSKEDADKVFKAIGPLGRASLAIELVSAADPPYPKPPTSAPTPPNR